VADIQIAAIFEQKKIQGQAHVSRPAMQKKKREYVHFRDFSMMDEQTANV
jgi:hypothetical protein